MLVAAIAAINNITQQAPEGRHVKSKNMSPLWGLRVKKYGNAVLLTYRPYGLFTDQCQIVFHFSKVKFLLLRFLIAVPTVLYLLNLSCFILRSHRVVD
jgi:hypothetical protein